MNVDFDVYRIRTKITTQGSTVEAEPYTVVGKRDRLTREMRWETLDSDLTYDADALDRTVVSEDQIRTVVRTFKDKLFTEIFPGRTDVPKTLIYAKASRGLVPGTFSASVHPKSKAPSRPCSA